MDARTILAELGHQLGLGPLELDEFGVCQIVFDKDLQVDVQAMDEDEEILLTAAICPAPASGAETLYRTLLEANLLGQGTGHACFALDAALDEVVLTQRLDLQLTGTARFRHELELFVDILAVWQRRKAEGVAAPDAPDDAGATPPTQAETFIRA